MSKFAQWVILWSNIEKKTKRNVTQPTKNNLDVYYTKFSFYESHEQ